MGTGEVPGERASVPFCAGAEGGEQSEGGRVIGVGLCVQTLPTKRNWVGREAEELAGAEGPGRGGPILRWVHIPH